jgi:phosphatidylserine decarboxylase
MVSYLAGKIERAWSTPTKWYPIPIALGALVLVAVQYRKQRSSEPEVTSQREGGAVLKPAIDGPWQVSTKRCPQQKSISRYSHARWSCEAMNVVWRR